jgi:hypothetical protein
LSSFNGGSEYLIHLEQTARKGTSISSDVIVESFKTDHRIASSLFGSCFELSDLAGETQDTYIVGYPNDKILNLFKTCMVALNNIKFINKDG